MDWEAKVGNLANILAIYKDITGGKILCLYIFIRQAASLNVLSVVKLKEEIEFQG